MESENTSAHSGLFLGGVGCPVPVVLAVRMGDATFIVLLWLIMSLVFGWGGNGKPYSLRFGFICGSGIALAFLATGYIHRYAGFALMFALLSLGIKTKFFERRWR
ncbi:hypothetical protein [Rhizobium phaseoli]|uniref:hypothetical protein n=1 Tax=Rhizobium phaseoli TaxID=396 RepID=UPI001F3D54E5|nr:hypothetical protein [Rhizobium phaseoli]